MDYIRDENNVPIPEKCVARVKAVYYHTMMDGNIGYLFRPTGTRAEGPLELDCAGFDTIQTGRDAALLFLTSAIRLILCFGLLIYLTSTPTLTEYMTDPQTHFEVIYK
jgi:hypothetical protein